MIDFSKNDLEILGNTHQGKDLLPLLIYKLITSSMDKANILDARFLYGEANFVRGFDGILSVKNGGTNIPDGNSIWEFGCSIDVKSAKAKIKEDFKKRTAGSKDKNGKIIPPTELPSGWKREGTSYVAVTFNTLDNYPELLNELNKPQIDTNGNQVENFKKCSIIDGQQIINWLEDNIPVEVWLNEQIAGRRVYNHIKTLTHFWSNWKQNDIPEELLLCGRENSKERVKNLLANGSGKINIIADSPEESVAFIYTVMNTLKEEEKKELGIRCEEILVLANTNKEDKNSLIQCINNSKSQIKALILIAPMTEYVLKISGVPLIICAHGAKPYNSIDPIILERARIHDFTNILQEKLLWEYKKAISESKKCGASPSIWLFQQNIGNHNYEKQFVWGDDHNIVPMVFLRSFSITERGDREVVEALSGKTFDDFKESIKNYMTCNYPLFSKEGFYYSLIAPTFAFQIVLNKITKTDLTNLKEICQKVFSDENRMFQKDDYSEFIHTKLETKYSQNLRDGLAETLLNIAVLGDSLKDNDTIDNPQTYVDEIVTSSLKLKENRALIYSLSKQFPVLIEAAPRPLLYALEEILEGDSAKNDIFTNINAYADFPPSTYFLWSLETIAWAPEYFEQACCIISRMAQIDPGGKNSNRPLNSLTEIFLAWSPQTYASFDQRIAVLKNIIKEDKNIGWNLLAQLLPHITGSISFPTSHPKLRDFSDNKQVIQTQDDTITAFHYYMLLAIDIAKNVPERWMTILNSYIVTSKENQRKILSELTNVAININEENKEKLFNVLYEFIDRNVSFANRASLAIPANDIEQFKAILDILNPNYKDNEKYELFNEYSPKILESKQDFDVYYKLVKQKRTETIKLLLDANNEFRALIDFSKKVKLTDIIATIISEILDEDKLFTLFINMNTSDNNNLRQIGSELSSNGSCIYKKSWLLKLTDYIQNNSPTSKQILNAVIRLTDEINNYRFIESLGENISIEYWKTRNALILINENDIESLIFALNKMAKFNRLYEVLSYGFAHFIKLEPKLVLGYLEQLKNEQLDIKQQSYLQMIRCSLEETFKFLKKSNTPIGILAPLEYFFLPFLDYCDGNLVIQEQIANMPELFIKLVCDIYYDERTGRKDNSTDIEKIRDKTARMVLNYWHNIPGQSGNTIDHEIFTSWIDKSLELAKENGRKTGVLIQIGKLLSNPMLDPDDGLWPHKEVREIIEKLKNQTLDNQISVEVHNSRGAFTKDIYEGGEQERALADKYRKWHKEMPLEYKRTRDLLIQIAVGWENQANFADNQTKERNINMKRL